MATPYDDLTMAVELDSRTWQALQMWAAKGLIATNDSLVRRGVTERESDYYRGQASGFIALLAIDEKRKTMLKEDASHD